MEERKFYIITVVLFVVFALLVILGNCAEAQETRRATGRVSPVAYDEECKYVPSPWGTTTSVEADDCLLNLVPMFVRGAKHEMVVKLITSEHVDEEGTTRTIDWSDGGLKEFRAEWDRGNFKWIEWYIRHPDSGEFEGPPALGCYANEIKGVVYKCFSGILDEKIK